MSDVLDKQLEPIARDEVILLGIDGPVATITLNRPKAMNALSMSVLEALQQCLDDLEKNVAVKALVIAGNEKAFSAGHDLREINEHRADPDGGKAFYEALFTKCTDVMLTIRQLPITVIAQVDGIATAAGCQLAATCDMIVASDRARFGVNGVDAGLFCSTPMVPLSRDIPRKAALEMLILGEIISAERAMSLGLVNHVVAPEKLQQTSVEFAKRASLKSRTVVGLGKRAFYEQANQPLDVAYENMKRVIVDNLMLPDACEGIDAFIKKRPPQWDE